MFSTGVLMTKPEKIIPRNQKFILIIKATLPYFIFLVVDKLFPPEVNKKSVVIFFGKYSSIEHARAASRALESICSKLIF